jgi:hypothetical protein
MARDPTDASWRTKVGYSDQLFGTRLVRLADGGGNGSRLLQVWTAGGLCFDVAVDRGFDIYRVIYRGRTIDWLAPQGSGPGSRTSPEAGDGCGTSTAGSS